MVSAVFASISMLLFLVPIVLPLPNGRNKLIYIMLDGFRYDYVDDQPSENIPGFSKFLQNGVRAEYMSPIFPSISYPDWTTLVTGLWAESHGIVGNYFYDAENRDEFSLFDEDSTGNQKWWTAEPIWATATKANRKTAVIFWSRCDIPFDGITPDYCEHFVKVRGYEIFRTNMEKALDKLEEGYDFIQVYNEHTDNVGHDIGPETEERKKAIRDLDPTIQYMLDRIDQLGMTDQVNIIIVSDHGMVTTAPGTVNRLELDDYLLTDYVENVADAGAFSNIKVRDGYVDQVYRKLSTMPGVNVYRHDDIPDDLHFKNNKYINDIILKADISTWIMKSKSAVQLPPRDDSYVYNGAHGFDPREEKMRAIFFAKGPDFKTGSQISPIQNVDVYPLLAHLLQVTPLPNNGTFGNIKMALRDDTTPRFIPIMSTTQVPLSNAVAIETGVLIPLLYLVYLFIC